MDKKTKIIIEFIIIILLIIGLGYYLYSDYISDKNINMANIDNSNQEIITEIATLDFTKRNKEISQEKMNKYEEQFRAAANKFLEKPDDIMAFWQIIEIAQIKQLIGDYAGVEQSLLFAEKLQPQSYLVHGNLGNLYFRYLQDFSMAEQYYLKAIKGRDPKIIPYYFELHEIYKYFFKQETNLAEEILKQGVETHPAATELMAVLADYYKESGNSQQAKIYYHKILEINPESQTAKNGLESLKD